MTKHNVETIAEDNPARETLATLAYNRIRDDIIAMRLEPGEKLRLRQACEMYDVGMSPLREALNRLVNESLVSQTDLRGFRVTELSADSLIALTHSRCLMNEVLIADSIRNGDESWIEAVVLSHFRASHKRVWLPEDDKKKRPEWTAANVAFHMQVVEASTATQLKEFYLQLFSTAERYRTLWVKHHTVRSASVDPHDAIKDAVIARDIELSVQLMNRHFRRAADLALERLNDPRRLEG